jgi:hypothetical protein
MVSLSVALAWPGVSRRGPRHAWRPWSLSMSMARALECIKLWGNRSGRVQGARWTRLDNMCGWGKALVACVMAGGHGAHRSSRPAQ